MSFLEIDFPEKIGVDARGGPMWSTVVTPSTSGREQRLQKWSNNRHMFDVSYGVKDLDDVREVLAFFNEVRGRAYGFRFKDWIDYQATAEVLAPDGSPTVQLIKSYGSGLNNYIREIKKPNAGITMTLNASSFTDFTLDTATGVVTFTSAQLSETIDSISQDTEARVVFDNPHGMSVGDKIYFTSVGGMTEINGQVGTITTVVDTTTVDVDIDSSGYSAHTSGGTGSVYVTAGDVFAWTGEFDVPVRFERDDLQYVLPTHTLGDIPDINLIEVRV